MAAMIIILRGSRYQVVVLFAVDLLIKSIRHDLTIKVVPNMLAMLSRTPTENVVIGFGNIYKLLFQDVI